MGNLGFRRSLVKDGTRLAKRGIFKSLGLTNELISSNPRPSLNYDFQNGRTLSPNFGYTPVAFSRASGGMQYDSSGRLVFSPENLFTYSEDQSNAVWAKNGSTYTANPTTPPSNISNCGKLSSDNTTAVHQIAQAVTVLKGGTYTTSWYLKAAELSWGQIVYSGATFGLQAYANFDLSNGTVSAVGSACTATITSMGNGWFRCSASAVCIADGSTTPVLVIIRNATDSRAPSYTGTTGNGIYFAAPQVERCYVPRAYNSTTSSIYYGPRFDYDPATLASRGLLIEEQRTNLCTYSNEFSNAAWGKTRCSVTADAAIAPDGALTADKLVEDTTASNDHKIISANCAVSTGVYYTASVYLKAAERSYAYVFLLSASLWPGASNPSVKVRLDTGAVVTNSNTSGFSVTSVGNGWYKVTISQQTVAAGNSGIIISTADNSGNSAYTGDGTSGVYVWGAQLEAGQFATSHIPTTSASVTRSADIATVTSVSWLNESEGALFSAWEQMFVDSSASARSVVLNVDDTTSNNKHTIFANAASGVSQGTTNVSGSATAGIASSTLTALTVYRSAYVYKLNDFTFYQNGTSLGTDVSGAVPTGLTQMRIGHRGADYLNGWLKSVIYYPRRMTNVELGQITT